MKSRKNLTEGNVYQTLMQIAIPASIGLFFNTMFNIVDTYFAGQLNTDALAALSISFPVFFIIVALTEGLSTAASALVSYHIGKKNHEQSTRIAVQVILYGFLATIVLTGIGLFCSEPLFELLGADGRYLDYSLEYIYTIFLGSVFFVFGSAMNGVLLAYGDASAMRNVLVAGFFLNCILDPWFLFGGFGLPAMGIQGIALATVVTKALSILYYIYLFKKEGVFEGLNWDCFRPNTQILLKITTHSIPASMNMMTIALGVFVTTYFIKGFGPEAVAAYGIGLRIEQLALLPTIGIGIALLSMVGQNYGASNMDRVIKSFQTALVISSIIITIGAIIIYIYPKELMMIFAEDEKVIEFGANYLRIAVFMSWSYVLSSTSQFTLQGLHRVVYPVGMGLFRQFIARIPLFFVVLHMTTWGIQGIWWSLFAINWFATTVTLLYTRFIIQRKTRELQAL